MLTKKIGRWAFVLGLLVAILLGFIQFGYSTIVLVVLGLVVGLLNVSEKESHGYLVAVIALLMIGFAGLQVFALGFQSFVEQISNALTSFITFVAASGFIVAIKEVVKMGED